MSKILCFGDSITWGAWDSKGGWVARIRKHVDQVCINSGLDTFVLTYNLGISSDTSERLLDRFENEVKAYTIEDGLPRFIISLGTNDSIWLPGQSAHMIDLSDFEKNLQKIIHQAKTYSDRIVFLGSMPVDESKTQPYTNSPDIVSRNADIKRYDEVTAKVCLENNIDFIEVFNESIASDYVDLLFSDGVHPNDKGHEYLAQKVLHYIEDKNWVRT
jgi:lysophospholipase L1-like esterase